MKVLLAGGAGYIGVHVYLEMVAAGNEVLIVDNLSNSKAAVFERLEQITKTPVKREILDVCDISAMRTVMSLFLPDVIIHFAGFKAVAESIEQPMRYYENNLVSTLTLCKLVEEFSVKRLIFSSSATVYGGLMAMPISEESPTGSCINPYGWTKYMNEQIIRDFALVHPKQTFVLLRYFNPIGAHESGLIGEDPMGIPNNIMPLLCQAALGKRDKFCVYGDDYPTNDGTCIRDYIHVVDLARGHVAACEKQFAEQDNGLNVAPVYNLGTGKGYSVQKILHTFMKANSIEIPYEITARRPGDLPVSYANPRKANDELGWRAQYDLERMCVDSWRWVKKNPNGYV